MIGNKFDKVIKDLTADESVDEEKEDTGISGEDLLAEQKRQEAMEKERKARQAKMEQDREEVRQKIRDKYNIKKKDELSTLAHGKTTTTTTTTLNENQTREVHQASNIENQVKPNEIHLDDNHQSATHLQSLCAPDEPALTLSSNGTVESISSTMERDRVNNFGAYKSSDNGDIRRMIGTNRHYSQRRFNLSQQSRHENNNACEFILASSVIRYSNILLENNKIFN
ncbi:unnamed protein product [Rotaria sp. Silwood1]|nr:unnamed protein product [Rotaria sp. Silwood1]